MLEFPFVELYITIQLAGSGGLPSWARRWIRNRTQRPPYENPATSSSPFAETYMHVACPLRSSHSTLS